MNQITLEISEKVLNNAVKQAARKNSRPEEVLADLLEATVDENLIDELPDADVLALARLQISDGLQEIFSDLLDKNGEGLLTADEKRQLDELGELCEQKTLQKAEALNIAVERGLIAPLSF